MKDFYEFFHMAWFIAIYKKEKRNGKGYIYAF